MTIQKSSRNSVRIAVFGASGFVGATFVERLLAKNRYAVRPIIHSNGNAGRLSRYGIELHCADVLDSRQVHKVLTGCTHVVNCSRGARGVLIKGMKNLLRACRSANIQRFVHLSSASVYGEPPPPESVHEDAPTDRPLSDYASAKLRQDQMVLRAHRAGLSCVILCPPHIYGPYSHFPMALLGSIARGELALVDGGRLPCNRVDVQNLAQAMELALFCDRADGRRIFITDDEETTWREIAEAMAPLAGFEPPFPSLTVEEARRIVGSDSTDQVSLRRSFGLLLTCLGSAEIRNKLRQDPWLRRIYEASRFLTGLLPKRVAGWLENRLSLKPSVSHFNPKPRFDRRLCHFQLCGVRHSCQRAKEVLGYSPEYSVSASMDVFSKWYAATHGWGSDTWPLARLLQFDDTKK